MPPEEDLKKRVGRKLTRRRDEGHRATMDFPDRFCDGDDAEEDCTAPNGQNVFMNQSVFGMIAAAGSQVDFNARFEGQSSDEEDESIGRPTREECTGPAPKPRADETTSPRKFRERFPESKLLRSLPHLGRKTSRQTDATPAPHGPSSPSPPTSSEQQDHLEEDTHATSPSPPRLAPVMSQMLEAKAELSMRPSFDSTRHSSEMPDNKDKPTIKSTGLAERLMEIFEFDKPEDVIEEYPCWLMKSVLLQGYMYITTKHICFYAYLPKKSNEVVKSGYLQKRGLKNPKYNRYWFRLKGDVLSYYSDPSDLYFPSGNIDLRYGISASIMEKDKAKDYFTVITHQRKYHFKADSAPSAKEWVKSLQKIIFRSHNDGDSVKISLPIENVIDIEDSQMIEFAETCKIRVIDNDETYAIDEYFFSFFSFGKEALIVLRNLIENTTAQQIPEDLLVHPVESPARVSHRTASGRRHAKSEKRIPSPINASTPALDETVKATLSSPRSPHHGRGRSPRASGDFSLASFDGRRSGDLASSGHRSVEMNRLNMDETSRSASLGQRSLSRTRILEENKTSEKLSSDSYVHSVEEPDSSAAVASTSDETHGSASQILRESDAFRPTIQQGSQPRDGGRTLGTRARPHSPSRALGTKGFSQRSHHGTKSGALECSSADQEESSAAPTLQNLVKAGSYPLQRAAGFAGYLNRHSKRMSNLLATESMGYVEKVSGMWKGGKKHYDDGPGAKADDEEEDDEDDEEHPGKSTRNRFRDHFALPMTEKLQATYFGYLHRVLPLYGKIYISDRSFCFRSMLPGTRTKLILPLKDIENVDKEKGFRFGYSGLVIVIKGHEEVFFEFGQPDTRDDCAVTLLQNLEAMRYLKESGLLSIEERESAEIAIAEHKALQEARQGGYAYHDVKMPQSADDVKIEAPPILFDDPRASILNFKPTESLRITCLTIGSRGDIQPYIALCKGLLAEGHKTKIATHREFGDWVMSHGIEFAPVEGDPAELMRICVENGMFTYSFLREASSKFRGWIDELLSSAWLACQDSDVLIESPSAMAGIHIAEALRIPYFRAFTMPWTRTRAYPHAFAVPEHKMGGAYNYITYVMFDNVFWKAIAGQVNRWRNKELELPRTNLEKMQPNKVPFLYNFSPSVVVPPLDYSDWIRVTGYWFLDEGTKYEPPKDLLKFIKKARADKKKLVYIGFGSIVVSDSAALTKTIVSSVLKADVRCILSKGWSDRLDKKNATEPEIPLPSDIFLIKSAPHDWLFKQIDAAAHHGGAGTTGASLRAGLPTIIKPFFGDQFFFGSRVEDLGVGIYLRKLNVSVFSRALWEAVHSARMIAKAKVLGEQIRKEDGVGTAIQCIYRDMEYAKTLIKKKDDKVDDDALEESEESWTFIGDDRDPDLVRRIQQVDLMAGDGKQLSMGTAALRGRVGSSSTADQSSPVRDVVV
ncbi:MAG: Sterol 3-beta-glucosyltransferase [Claussenomyces sp. TS43310]|nr:MAG: Sterol 3-beta-glucosyltransferase [Claussenomyces sp. TS43310]